MRFIYLRFSPTSHKTGPISGNQLKTLWIQYSYYRTFNSICQTFDIRISKTVCFEELKTLNANNTKVFN